MSNPTNKHREQAREQEAERIVRYCESTTTPFQQKMGYTLDALSSRDVEIREVLEALSWTDDGDGEVIMHWCNEDRWCDEVCDAARALYASLQPASPTTPSPSGWCEDCGSRNIVTIQQFATAAEFLEAYNQRAEES